MSSDGDCSGGRNSGLPTAASSEQEYPRQDCHPLYLSHREYYIDQWDYQQYRKYGDIAEGFPAKHGRSAVSYHGPSAPKSPRVQQQQHIRHHHHQHTGHPFLHPKYPFPSRQCRLRRSLQSMAYGVMLCTFLWIFIYTLSFSCCVGNSRLDSVVARDAGSEQEGQDPNHVYGVVGATRRLHNDHRLLHSRTHHRAQEDSVVLLHGAHRRRSEEDEDDTIYNLPEDDVPNDSRLSFPGSIAHGSPGEGGDQGQQDRYLYDPDSGSDYRPGHPRTFHREGHSDYTANNVKNHQWREDISSNSPTGDTDNNNNNNKNQERTHSMHQSDSSHSSHNNNDIDYNKNRKFDNANGKPQRRRGGRGGTKSRPDPDVWAKQGYTRKLPHGLIIGVKKGGTRALLEFLRVHPDIRAPGPEPHFFDRNYEKGLEWYRSQMPPSLDSQLTLEKTPSYFVTKGVPGRIFNMSRDIKLIVVVRDPVTRAISDYTQSSSKRSDVKAFEQMAFLDNATGLVDTSWGAIRIGVYAKHLERWLKYFPLTQMHFVSGERLISDPAAELAKVQDFLGLKRVITDKHFYFNSTKGFPCLKKPEGSGNPHCLGKTKGRPHPKVDPKVIKRLHDFYRPFNAKFYQMTNIDFGWP